MANFTLSEKIKNCEKAIENIYDSLKSLMLEIENHYPQQPKERRNGTTQTIKYIYPENSTSKLLKKLLYREVAIPARVSGIHKKSAQYYSNRIRGKPLY